MAESYDGLLLATVQVYSPPVVTVRVWVYWAVTGSSNTVSVPSVTGVESLVQDTVVAIPPVEIQVRVIVIESTVSVGSPNIEISPRKGLIPFHTLNNNYTFDIELQLQGSYFGPI